jgi:hypothetical protein
MTSYSSDAAASSVEPNKIDCLSAGLCAAAIALLTLLWFHFDQSVPTQDEAGHILRSMSFRDYLSHCRPWQYPWWCKSLTISTFYPPFAYLVNGSILLLLGQSRFSEQVGMSLFAAVMALALFAITRLVGGSRGAAFLSVFCLSSYPIVTRLSHSYFLDLPELAMTAAGIAALLWWRSDQPPKVWRTLLSGIILAAACLTKQLVVAYLIPTGIYFLFSDLRRALSHQNDNQAESKLDVRLRAAWLIHTVALGLVTTLLTLPVVLHNYASNRGWAAANLEVLSGKIMHPSFLNALWNYTRGLPDNLSPILLTIFVVSAFSLRQDQYLRLLPVIVSSTVGFILTCANLSVPSDERYILPMLISPAILSGLFLARQLDSSNKLLRLSTAFVLVLSGAFYISGNFTPYPLPLPKLPGTSERQSNPTRFRDWGYPLVVQTIEASDPDKVVFLNLLPNHSSLHVQAFQLFLAEQKIRGIIPITSRVCTILGDRLSFSPRTALYSQWYLWKTGPLGFPLLDKASEDSLKQLIDFVRNSGEFKLMARAPLPDGNELMLYRQRENK